MAVAVVVKLVAWLLLTWIIYTFPFMILQYFRAISINSIFHYFYFYLRVTSHDTHYSIQADFDVGVADNDIMMMIAFIICQPKIPANRYLFHYIHATVHFFVSSLKPFTSTSRPPRFCSSCI